jgi:hypothetical protein
MKGTAWGRALKQEQGLRAFDVAYSFGEASASAHSTWDGLLWRVPGPLLTSQLSQVSTQAPRTTAMAGTLLHSLPGDPGIACGACLSRHFPNLLQACPVTSLCPSCPRLDLVHLCSAGVS